MPIPVPPSLQTHPQGPQKGQEAGLSRTHVCTRKLHVFTVTHKALQTFTGSHTCAHITHPRALPNTHVLTCGLTQSHRPTCSHMLAHTLTHTHSHVCTHVDSRACIHTGTQGPAGSARLGSHLRWVPGHPMHFPWGPAQSSTT